MAAKKPATETTPEVKESTEEVVAPTAEELLEAEAEAADLLADLPALRPPTELRLAARNKIKTIQMDHGRKLARIIGEAQDGVRISDLPEDTAIEYVKHMMGVQEAVDEFAESIAIDKPGYIAWSNAHADDYGPFMAILMRYAGAVGESSSSAS